MHAHDSIFGSQLRKASVAVKNDGRSRESDRERPCEARTESAIRPSKATAGSSE